MGTTLNLTAIEKEVLILKSALGSINSMVNFVIVDFHHNDPNSEVRCKSRTHQQYFNIILLDFMHSEVFQVEKNCLEGLQRVCENPQFGSQIEGLKDAVTGFQIWLGQDVELVHNGETEHFWFPSLDSPSLNGNIPLKITRSEFIKICGNISKHNPLGLDRQAKTIQSIFAKNKITLDLTQALLAMEDFYILFHDDVFAYHVSTIAEFLNNIRLGIHEYLATEFEASVTHFRDPDLHMASYKFRFPSGVTNPFVQTVYWELMNDIPGKSFMPKFAVSKYLKMHF